MERHYKSIGIGALALLFFSLFFVSGAAAQETTHPTRVAPGAPDTVAKPASPQASRAEEANLSVSTGVSADVLAQSLAGSGVTIQNVTYTGAGAAAGTFTGGGDVVGFDQGVILSSGSAGFIVGPNTSESIGAANGTPGDVDLSDLAGGSTFDAAVLEFEFIPSGDMVTFDFVFASDEYNEFVGQGFNDVFGFFVNGRNCATAGNPPVPVSIDTINLESNASLFLNNDLQSGTPLNTEADGLTVALLCQAEVQRGVRNTMKLAIADVGDNGYDSWVLIRSASFTSLSEITLAPNEATNQLDTEHTVTATIRGGENNQPLPGVDVAFEIISGPHEGLSGLDLTDQNGEATFTYTGVEPGTDEIQAGFTNQQGQFITSNIVTKTWLGTVLAVNPTVLDFGEVSLGEQATLNTLQLSNPGTTDLVVEGLRLAGAASADYAISTQAPFVLPPGASISVPVTFTPSALGSRPAVLEIASNAQTNPLATVELRGVGIGEGELNVSDGTLDFGTVIVGNTATLPLTVTNGGTSGLEVTDIAIAGTGAAAFTADADAFALGSGQSRVVNVRFAPGRGGAFSATLTVTSDGGNAEVTLTGTGAAPTLFVSANRVDFGTVPVDTMLPRTITITNQGTAPLTLQPPTILGGSGRYAITGGGGARQLAPGASHIIEITFSPTTVGTVNGTLRILSNDPNRPQADVALVGVGLIGLALSPDAIDFGAVRVGEAAEETVTVNNLSNGPVTLTGYGQTTSDIAVEPAAPVVVPGSGATTLTLRYTPMERGDDSGVLTIESNAPGQVPLQVAITAQAVAPVLTLSQETVGFGTVTLGLSASESFSISNTGDAPLDVTVQPVSGVFAVAGGTFTLAPGAERAVEVEFTPVVGGPQSATVQIQSDDPDQPTAEVSLTGSGMAIQVDEPDPPGVNESAPVSFTLPQDFQPTTAQLFVRPVGGAYQAFPLDAAANVFSGSIPPGLVTARGVQYYASFSDGVRTLTIPAANPSENPLQLRVEIDSFAPPFTPSPESYRMVSVPGVLNDVSVPSVLADDFGLYDPDVYRVFRWDPAAEAYDEYPDPSVTFAPGRANWLITRDGLPFDADEAVSTEAVAQSLTLQPGWNQIGNPFAFPVAWSGSAPVEGPRLYLSNGDYAPPASVVLPWEGYFVFNAGGSPAGVTVQPVEVALGNAAKGDTPAFLAVSDYVLQLRGVLDGYNLRDQHNYLGLAAGAAEGRDAMDFTEPPSLGDHLRVAIVEGDARLSGSFRPAGGSGQAWDIEVAAVFTGEVLPLRKRASVSLLEHGTRPDGFDLVVLDLDRERAVPLDEGRFEVDLDGGVSVRHFRVLAGTVAFLEGAAGDMPLTPQGFALEGNYPNPFNPETVIRYRLAAPTHAVIEVFDTLGRRVRTLLDARQDAGLYEIRWDARDDAGQAVASGVYVARLRAGGESATLPMLLLR